MAQVYGDLYQDTLFHSPPEIDNILDLVNERLLLPVEKQRTSQLENYFLGYKEHMETPPSPAPSDPEDLFSYLDHSSTNLTDPPPAESPRRASPPPVSTYIHAQGKTTTSPTLSPKLPSIRKVARLRRKAKSTAQAKQNSRSTAEKQTQAKGEKSTMNARMVKSGRIGKAPRRTHRMETRSQSSARKLRNMAARKGVE